MVPRYKIVLLVGLYVATLPLTWLLALLGEPIGQYYDSRSTLDQLEGLFFFVLWLVTGVGCLLLSMSIFDQIDTMAAFKVKFRAAVTACYSTIITGLWMGFMFSKYGLNPLHWWQHRAIAVVLVVLLLFLTNAFLFFERLSRHWDAIRAADNAVTQKELQS